MNRKLTRDLSANALQLILNQLFGLVIFYVLSTSLNKTEFGQLNLALAILLAVFNILSLGIDQLIVKKIASGNDLCMPRVIYRLPFLRIFVYRLDALPAGRQYIYNPSARRYRQIDGLLFDTI